MSIIEIILVIIIFGFYVFILLDTDQLKKENKNLSEELEFQTQRIDTLYCIINPRINSNLQENLKN